MATLADPPIDPALMAALRAQVPAVAELTVRRVVTEVPEYVGALDGDYRAALEDGVRMAFDGSSASSSTVTPPAPSWIGFDVAPTHSAER